MYLVKEFFNQHGDYLQMKLVAGNEGMSRSIKVPESQRPGLALSGYLKGHAEKRILILGKVEMEYLKSVDSDVRIEKLTPLFTKSTPAIIVARRYTPLPELKKLCEERNLPLFITNLSTMTLTSKLTLLLAEQFASKLSCHGTLVEVYGVGVLIQGDSSVGKSETALGLLEKGHRLISDDVVKITKREELYLEGSGDPVTQYHMEIRGIGIVNIAHLYGAVCVRKSKHIDMAIKLEEWDDNAYYDRVGLEEKFHSFLGIKIPFHIIPVKPGRDVVLLIETIALNHRLKKMGYHSAKEFSAKLKKIIQNKQISKTKTDKTNG